MQEEKIVPSKIRYTQKLADLDRRMKVLEKERQVDKEVRFQQTRTLEYLEANVESLKKQDKPLKIKDKFERLVEKWKEETEFVSTVLEMATHPAYQQIIGMGESAIPLILERLENHSEHWFWALNAITGENPVSKQSYGKVDEMREAWLKWGQTKGYGSPTRARDKRTS